MRSRRRSERLDPARRRLGPLLRLAAVAALLVTAAVAMWSGPPPCAPAPESAAARPAPRTADPGGIPAGRVGVPVRLADPGALTLVRPGHRVDLLRPGDTAPVASAALVLDVRGAGDPGSGALLLALSPAEAQRAVTAPEPGFAVLIRPG